MIDCLVSAKQASYRACAKRANDATNAFFLFNALLPVELERNGEF